VIGDLLALLLELLEIEAPGTMTVSVGDYIDRGDHSAAVLRMLMDCCADPDGNFVCIAGNHERMLLDFLGAPTDRSSRWLRNGGLQTLTSFGFTGITANATGDDLIVAARDLRPVMGKQMIS
jgi:serine/threonine protein phosphatase 1